MTNKLTNEYIYSATDEDWSDLSLPEAVQEAFEQLDDMVVGDTLTVYQAASQKLSIEELIPSWLGGHVLEEIEQNLYDKIGDDVRTDWLDNVHENKFNRFLQLSITEYLKLNNPMPEFFVVENIKEIEVKLTDISDETDVKFEVITFGKYT